MSDNDDAEIVRPPKTREIARPEPVTFGEVAARVLDQAATGINNALEEYERMRAEVARLNGICEALARENEWLRKMIDKVVK